MLDGSMTDRAGSDTRRRNPLAGTLGNLLLTLGSVLTCLLVLEATLRFLPVSDSLRTQPVNAANPVYHFEPNRDVLRSQGWNFEMVNRVHVNNAGFVNDQDYVADDPRPLLAVVGDSYVEALNVPPSETLHARLARAAGGKARVYSFAASGAPLSQYPGQTHEISLPQGAARQAISVSRDKQCRG